MSPRRRLLVLAAIVAGIAAVTSGVAAADDHGDPRPDDEAPTIIIIRPVPVASAVAEPTPGPTPSPSVSPTPTASPTPTPTPTASPTPTSSPTATPTPTAAPTPTPTPTPQAAEELSGNWVVTQTGRFHTVTDPVAAEEADATPGAGEAAEPTSRPGSEPRSEPEPESGPGAESESEPEAAEVGSAERYTIGALFGLTIADGGLQPHTRAPASDRNGPRSTTTAPAADGRATSTPAGAETATAAAGNAAVPPQPTMAPDTKLRPERSTSASAAKGKKAAPVQRSARKTGPARRTVAPQSPAAKAKKAPGVKAGKSRRAAVSAGKARAGRKATASTTRRAQIRKATAQVKRSLRARAAAQRRRAIPTPTIIDVPLARVRGILVHRRIGGKTEALLRAADRAGLRLNGWGYRSTVRQIQLRRAHCGTSRYAMFKMPSGRCWPPTAPPGTSMHERGLAIDFYVEGRKGRAKPIAGTREFRWLKRHAHKFGFYNLPSEAWHWSTNGR